MLTATTITAFILAGCALAATAFYLLSMIAAYRFFSQKNTAARRHGDTEQWPPVSVMIPLHGADFEAYQNYARFCNQDYPQFQLVFGVREADDSSIPIVEQLKRDFPAQDIELVISPRVMGTNLKVSNLENMLARVRYEQIIIVDSDIRVESDYLRRIIAELQPQGVGLVTCLYRAAEARDFASKLEAVGITAEFAAGVLMARMLEGMRFALGSTMATTRARLAGIGGFRALKDYLADDFMLGNLIAAAGFEVRLSRTVVETAMPALSFAGMLRHQMRWARSTRISRPAGYLGLLLTYGTALALLDVAVMRASWFSLGLLVLTLAVRLLMAWLIGVHYLEDRILKRHFYLVPLRDLLSFLIWAVSWFGRTVEWRGRRFEVQRDGRMVQVAGQPVVSPTE
ncbi:MAG TPA: bacteriohopanetetrol glucosamine biosynthesis glycosyltransferase HpnI [Blastocatellia bacterium]|nr:bacteriohopanetetrol glucosamine biosynthesis glycosyltransferase HpnI [Blastocatellia bacterium]